MDRKNRNIAIWLSVLWFSSSFAFCIFAFIARLNEYRIIAQNTSVHDISSMIVLLAVGCYFIPLLLHIKKYAELASMKKYAFYVKIISVCFSSAFVIALVSTICELISTV